MSDTPDDIRRMLAEQQTEREYGHLRPGPCDCGGRFATWVVIGTDTAYGADADGRRGTLLVEWECSSCEQAVQMY